MFLKSESQLGYGRAGRRVHPLGRQKKSDHDDHFRPVLAHEWAEQRLSCSAGFGLNQRLFLGDRDEPQR